MRGKRARRRQWHVGALRPRIVQLPSGWSAPDWPNLAALHLRAAARDDTAGAQEIRRLRGEPVAPSG